MNNGLPLSSAKGGADRRSSYSACRYVLRSTVKWGGAIRYVFLGITVLIRTRRLVGAG